MPAATEPKEVKTLIEEFNGALSEFGARLDQQEKDIKENGETRGTTAQSIKGMEDRILNMGKEIQEAVKRLNEAEAKSNRPGGLFGGDGILNKSIGDLVCQSEQYKSSKLHKSERMSPVEVKSFIKRRAAFPSDLLNSIPESLKADPTLASDAADTSITTGLVQAFRLPSIIELGQQAPRMMDLVTVVPTTRGNVEYVRETGFNHLHTQANGAAGAGVAVVTVDNTYGFYVGQACTIEGVTGTREIDTGGVDHAALTLTFTANFGGTGVADRASITADRFVCTPETKVKPNARAQFEVKNTAVKTLAHWIPITRQIMSDMPALMTYLNTRLLLGVELSRERMMLYGDGTDEQLDGILQDSDILTYSWSDGLFGDTKLDALVRAATFAELAFYPVTGGVLHPTDWSHIELAKGSDGHYLWFQIQTRLGKVISGYPIITTSSIDQGSGLIGAWATGVTLWDRGEASVRIAEQHADYFIRNMLVVLAEERIAQTVNVPPSFTAVDFDNTPQA